MKGLFIHVPKTGGSSIRAGFGQKLPPTGHNSAVLAQRHYPQEFREAWKFAFVRNPWDHAASWFFYSHHRHDKQAGLVDLSVDELRIRLRRWLREESHEMIGEMSRNFYTMFHDHDGKCLVDTVFRFEEFRVAWREIAGRLGVPDVNMRQDNMNPYKPTIPSRDLFDDWSRAYVQGIQWWAVKEFGYEFD